MYHSCRPKRYFTPAGIPLNCSRQVPWCHSVRLIKESSRKQFFLSLGVTSRMQLVQDNCVLGKFPALKRPHMGWQHCFLLRTLMQSYWLMQQFLLTRWIGRWHTSTHNISAQLLLLYLTTPIEKPIELFLGWPSAVVWRDPRWPNCLQHNVHPKMVRLHQILRSCLWLPCKWSQDVAHHKGAVHVQSQRAIQRHRC